MRFNTHITLDNPVDYEAVQVAVETLHMMRESAGIAETDVVITISHGTAEGIGDAIIVRMETVK